MGLVYYMYKDFYFYGERQTDRRTDTDRERKKEHLEKTIQTIKYCQRSGPSVYSSVHVGVSKDKQNVLIS